MCLQRRFAGRNEPRIESSWRVFFVFHYRVVLSWSSWALSLSLWLLWLLSSLWLWLSLALARLAQDRWDKDFGCPCLLFIISRQDRYQVVRLKNKRGEYDVICRASTSTRSTERERVQVLSPKTRIVGRHIGCFKSQFIVHSTVFEQRSRAKFWGSIGCWRFAGFWDQYSGLSYSFVLRLHPRGSIRLAVVSMEYVDLDQTRS